MLAGRGVRPLLGQLGILDEERRRVDPHTRDAALEPEAEDVLVLGADVGVLPVEIGLLGAKRCRYHSPSVVRVQADPPKIDCQSFGGQLAVRTRCPPGTRSARAPATRAGAASASSEPRVLVRDVVRNDVDDRADPERPRLGDQLLCLGERPECRIDRAVVRDVVAGVGERRRVPGVEPESVDAERAQVRKPRPDTGEVADPVAVSVGEAADVDLVDDRFAPPGALGHPRFRQRRAWRRRS